MNRKKYLTGMIFLVLSVVILPAEEKLILEALWKAALETNIDIKASETEAFDADLRRRYYSVRYAPSIITKGSNTFAPTPQRGNGILSDMSTFTLVYGQLFTGGATLTTEFGYSLTRPFTPEGIYAVQAPSLNITLSQGLQPWWLQGLKKNPELSLLENTIAYRQIQLIRQKKSILIALTQDFLELRKTERTILLLKNTIVLRTETLASLTQLFEQGALNMTKIWDEKQLLLDDENALVLNRGYLDRLKERLRTTCGIIPEGALGSVLPQKNSMPSNTPISGYPGNLDTSEIETQITSLSLTQAQRKQNTAPTVTLSADLSWPLETKKITEWNKAWSSAKDDNQKPLYTISLGFDFSPLFSNSNIRDRQMDENTMRLLEAKKKATTSIEQHQKKLMEINLVDLHTQIDQYRFAVQQTTALCTDAETLAQMGAISTIELQTFHLKLQKREVVLADCEDQEWYISWYLYVWMH